MFLCLIFVLFAPYVRFHIFDEVLRATEWPLLGNRCSLGLQYVFLSISTRLPF